MKFTDDNDKPLNLIVDGKTGDLHNIIISETMSPFTFDFKIQGESDS